MILGVGHSESIVRVSSSLSSTFRMYTRPFSLTLAQSVLQPLSLSLSLSLHFDHNIQDIQQNKKRMYVIRGLLGLSTTTFDATGDYTQVKERKRGTKRAREKGVKRDRESGREREIERAREGGQTKREREKETGDFYRK